MAYADAIVAEFRGSPEKYDGPPNDGSAYAERDFVCDFWVFERAKNGGAGRPLLKERVYEDGFERLIALLRQLEGGELIAFELGRGNNRRDMKRSIGGRLLAAIRQDLKPDVVNGVAEAYDAPRSLSYGERRALDYCYLTEPGGVPGRWEDWLVEDLERDRRVARELESEDLFSRKPSRVRA